LLLLLLVLAFFADVSVLPLGAFEVAVAWREESILKGIRAAGHERSRR
jgi:hypothetical protein